MRAHTHPLNRRPWIAVALVSGALVGSTPAAELAVQWQRGGHRGGCTVLTCSPDGATAVSGSWDSTIKFWRVSDGQLLRTWRTSGGRPEVLTYTPDGAHLAVGDVYDVDVYNLATGAIERTLTEHFSLVSAIEFSPDQQWVATLGSFDGLAFLRDAATWAVVHELPKPPDVFFLSPFSITFSPNSSKAYVLGYGGEVVEYRVADGAYLRTLGNTGAGHGEIVRSPDGTLLMAGDAAGNVHRWSLPSGTPLAPINAHSAEITRLRLSPDGGRFLTACVDGVVRVWRVSDGALLQTIAAQAAEVRGADFTADGAAILTGTDSADNAVRLWDAATGQMLRQFTVHTGAVRGLAFRPDGAALASGGGGDVRLWDPQSGAALGEILAAHAGDIAAIAFSPDGTLLATCASGSAVKLWAYPSLTFVDTLPTHTDFVTEVAFSPDGAWLATAGVDGDVASVKLVRLSDSQLVHTLTGYTATPHGLAFSPDGATLAAAGDDVLKLWRVSDGALLHTLSGHTNWITCVAYAPNGAVVATSSTDKTIRLWNPSDGSLLRVLTGAELAHYALAFSADGRTIVSSGWTNSVAVWRAADGALLQRYAAPLGTGLECLAFAPDGLRLAIGRFDATVVLAHRPPATGGDLDIDGDVDSGDQAVFDACLAGPGVAGPLAPGCTPQDFASADLDGDGDVDLADGAVLQQVHTGSVP